MSKSKKPGFVGPICWTLCFAVFGVALARSPGMVTNPLLVGVMLGMLGTMTLSEWMLWGYRRIIADYVVMIDDYSALVDGMLEPDA
jgi:hypothetical protein